MNMTQSGELEKVMTEFEKNSAGLYGMQFKREKREIGQPFENQAYYCHGETNNAFRMFLHGYSLGKATERLNNV
jgi:hypothetical protein